MLLVSTPLTFPRTVRFGTMLIGQLLLLEGHVLFTHLLSSAMALSVREALRMSWPKDLFPVL